MDTLPNEHVDKVRSIVITYKKKLTLDYIKMRVDEIWF